MAIEKDLLIETGKKIFPDLVVYEFRDQLTLIFPPEFLIKMCREFKENEQLLFDQLVDVTAIDWMDKRKPRFETVYFLYSIKNKQRIRFKCPIGNKELKCPTLTPVYESANWYERETYDMYGIIFTDHPGLRRFYMPEDYVDPVTKEPLYPLRKDFPLMGIPDSLPLPQYPERDNEPIRFDK